jgi:hypothetical protein
MTKVELQQIFKKIGFIVSYPTGIVFLVGAMVLSCSDLDVAEHNYWAKLLLSICFSMFFLGFVMINLELCWKFLKDTIRDWKFYTIYLSILILFLYWSIAY